MIDLWNTSNKDNYVLCYGYKHTKNVNVYKIKEKASQVFRARENRSRLNAKLVISDSYMANKNLIFLETGDNIGDLVKDDAIVYLGKVLIIEETSTKIYNQQLAFGNYKPSKTTSITCRGDI